LAVGFITPLTPALSPLRGEGVAVDALGNLTRFAAFAAEVSVSDARSYAAAIVELVQSAVRAPSPLNGERAGVRGVNADDATNIDQRPSTFVISPLLIHRSSPYPKLPFL